MAGLRGKNTTVDKVVQAATQLRGRSIPTRHRPKIDQIIQQSQQLGVRVGISYDKIRPFRTQMLRRETHRIELIIRGIDDTKDVEIVGFPSTATDALVVRDVATHILHSAKVDPVSTHLRDLAADLRIRLFDRIFSSRRPNQWRVEDVTSLTIRPNADRSTDKDEGDQALGAAETRALSQAVLNGRGLRDQTIVKNLVDGGYHFASARMLVFHPSGLGIVGSIDVEINFKRNPEVLWLSVRNKRVAKVPDDASDASKVSFESVPVEGEVASQVLEYYWREVHQVYADLTTPVRGKAVNRALQAPLSITGTSAPIDPKS